MICSRCHREIPENVTSYLVRISITADFNEKLNPVGPEQYEEIIMETKKYTAAQLEAEVHAERGYTICRPCRDAFVKNPLGCSKGAKSARPTGMVH